jgi:ABC-type antimicrobial peptide transport system permease subunit
MADLHWADSDPVGQRIQFGSGPREIVGVVANERDQGAGNRERPKIYFASMQTVLRSMSWVVETSTASPQMLTDAIRAEVGIIAPNLPLYDVAALDAVIREEIRSDAIMPKVMAALSIIALLLAIGGVYGVMAYSVSQRTRELGIRMALGAQGRGVMSMVVWQGTILAGVGVAIGIGLALAVSRTLSVFLFGVSPFDPLTFGAVAIFLLGAGVAASYFPARKATRVDPMIALRTE